MKKLFLTTLTLLLLVPAVALAGSTKMRTYTLQPYGTGYAQSGTTIGPTTAYGGTSKFLTWTKNGTVANTVDNRTLDLATYAPNFQDMTFQIDPANSGGVTTVGISSGLTSTVSFLVSNYNNATAWAGASEYQTAINMNTSGVSTRVIDLPTMPKTKYMRIKLSSTTQWATPTCALVVFTE